MHAPTDLPPESHIIVELVLYLNQQTRPVALPEAYRALAAIFGLTHEQRTRLTPDGKEVHWENRVRFARRKLVDAGIIDGSVRGRWALKKGVDVFSALAAVVPVAAIKAAVERLKSKGADLKEGAADLEKGSSAFADDATERQHRGVGSANWGGPRGPLPDCRAMRAPTRLAESHKLLADCDKTEPGRSWYSTDGS